MPVSGRVPERLPDWIALEIDPASGRSTTYVEGAGRSPDGLALDRAGALYVSCYASDDIHRISPDGAKTLFAHDRWAILLSRPTNIAFRDGYIYVANLGRRSITRARTGCAADRDFAFEL